jgi:hypothetical protein
VAVTAALALVTSDPVVRLLPLNLENRGADFNAFFVGVHSFAGGGGPSPYSLDPPLFYPAPYVVLLSPLGLLSAGLALVAARVLGAALLAAVIWGWTSASPRRWDGWLLALSLPAVALVFLSQLPTALGLAALSLAVWAQRREMWVLAGALLAIGLIRLTNGPAVLAMLLVGAGWRWRALAALLGGAAAVLLVLGVAAWIWDPHWVGEYAVAVGRYSYTGPVWLAAQRIGGTFGPLVLLLASAAIAAWMVRRSAGRPLDVDSAAAVLALTTLTATFPAVYAAVFAIPGLVRASLVPGLRPIIPLAVVLPWVLALPLLRPGANYYILAPTAELMVAAFVVVILIRRRAST